MGLTTFMIALFIVLVGTWASQSTSRTLYGDEAFSMVDMHQKWMFQYGRTYSDDAEKEMRSKIFMENVRYVENFNKQGNHSYKLSINEFADLTTDEFLKYYTGSNMPTTRNSKLPGSESFRYENLTAVSATMDWRDKGAVTPIKDQGKCAQVKSRKLHDDEASAMVDMHQKWISQYGLTYADEAETSMRSKIFMDNVGYVENFNKERNHSYKLNINDLADLKKKICLANLFWSHMYKKEK